MSSRFVRFDSETNIPRPVNTDRLNNAQFFGPNASHGEINQALQTQGVDVRLFGEVRIEDRIVTGADDVSLTLSPGSTLGFADGAGPTTESPSGSSADAYLIKVQHDNIDIDLRGSLDGDKSNISGVDVVLAVKYIGDIGGARSPTSTPHPPARFAPLYPTEDVIKPEKLLPSFIIKNPSDPDAHNDPAIGFGRVGKPPHGHIPPCPYPPPLHSGGFFGFGPATRTAKRYWPNC